MKKEVRRLERLYLEVMELSLDEFDIFERLVIHMGEPILYSFCEQIKRERGKV